MELAAPAPPSVFAKAADLPRTLVIGMLMLGIAIAVAFIGPFVLRHDPLALNFARALKPPWPAGPQPRLGAEAAVRRPLDGHRQFRPRRANPHRLRHVHRSPVRLLLGC